MGEPKIHLHGGWRGPSLRHASQELVWHRQGSSASEQLSSWQVAAMGRWESLQGEATLFLSEVRVNFETGIFTFSVKLSTSAIMEFLNRVAAVRGLLVTSVMLSFPSGHIIFNTGLELWESLFNCSLPAQSNSWFLPRPTAASSSQGITQTRVTLLGTRFCALKSKFNWILWKNNQHILPSDQDVQEQDSENPTEWSIKGRGCLTGTTERI